MKTKQKAEMADFGPCAIPLVPITHFSKFRFTHNQWLDVWRLIGPSAKWNMDRNPIWLVIACAYLEGLQHGSEIMKEKNSSPAIKTTEPEFVPVILGG